MAQAQTNRLERTAPYLKPSQVEALTEEKTRIEGQLNAPLHLRRAIQDPALMAKTLRGIQTALNNDAPKPYEGAEKDAAVKREAELRERITQGMATQAEMRRNPPGALDKHIMWEERNEADIGEWKNLRRRMLASGMLPSSMSERSASNIELLRPAGGSGELNMDNAQIPQTKTYYGLGGRSSPLTERELELLKLLAPDIYEKVALLTADQRDDLKAALAPAAAEATDDATLESLNLKDARERCRALGLETGGSKDEMIMRLKAHYKGA